MADESATMVLHQDQKRGSMTGRALHHETMKCKLIVLLKVVLVIVLR